MGDSIQEARLSHRHAKRVTSSTSAAGAAATPAQSKWVWQMDPHGSLGTGRLRSPQQWGQSSPGRRPAAAMHAGSFLEEQKGSPQCLRDCGEKGASGNTRKKKGDIEKKTTKKMSGGKNLNSTISSRTLQRAGLSHLIWSQRKITMH